MTKDQLIQSFQNSGISMASGSLTLGSWITIILGVILAVFLLTREDLNPAVSLFAMFGVVLVVLMIQNSPSRGFHTQTEYDATLREWKIEYFEGQYLKGKEKERFDIGDHTLTPEGHLAIALDTNKKKQTVKDVENIEYIGEGSSYLEAVWVDGLAEYGIDDGYYSTKAYIKK